MWYLYIAIVIIILGWIIIGYSYVTGQDIFIDFGIDDVSDMMIAFIMAIIAGMSWPITLIIVFFVYLKKHRGG